MFIKDTFSTQQDEQYQNKPYIKNILNGMPWQTMATRAVWYKGTLQSTKNMKTIRKKNSNNNIYSNTNLYRIMPVPVTSKSRSNINLLNRVMLVGPLKSRGISFHNLEAT